jgi:hypothetical protein
MPRSLSTPWLTLEEKDPVAFPFSGNVTVKACCEVYRPLRNDSNPSDSPVCGPAGKIARYSRTDRPGQEHRDGGAFR